MKMARLFLFITFFLNIYFAFGQTQLEINTEANMEFYKADSELNVIYNKILVEYKTDTAFIKNLKLSQNIWIKFRDAEMKVKFPDRERGYYGSVQPMCWSLYKAQLTEDRIKSLKIWIDGTEEGDSCSGSVKMKK